MAAAAPLRPLQPFTPQPELAAFSLEAAAQLAGPNLQVQMRLQGPLEQLQLPEPTTAVERRDGLWQSTCFEAFVGQAAQPHYWEINLCPSGHWAVYALSGYRAGLQAEGRVQGLPFERRQRLLHSGLSELELAFSLALPLPAEPGPLEISATAVLEHRQLGCSYWAWRHCGNEADFHRRDSFLPLT